MSRVACRSQLAHLCSLSLGTLRQAQCVALALVECSDVVGRLLKQTDRSRAPPPQGRPILRCLSWRARQLAGLQGRKPWEATLAGASSRALLNLAFAGGPTRSVIPRWGPGAGEEVEEEGWAGSAGSSARGRPQGSGQEAGQQCTAHLHTPPLHF